MNNEQVFLEKSLDKNETGEETEENFQEIPKRPLQSILSEAKNQIVPFGLMLENEDNDINFIREIIKESDIRNIEEFLNLSKEEINESPELCDEYNKLVKEINDPDISVEKIKEIVDKVKELTTGNYYE